MNTQMKYLVATWCLLAVAGGSEMSAQPTTLGEPPVFHEIEIEFENARGTEIAIEPPSGWPLTLILTANDSIPFGLGTAFGYTTWPYRTEAPPPSGRFNSRIAAEVGFLVFQDPYENVENWDDWCPSWTNRLRLEEHLEALGSLDPYSGTAPPQLKLCPMTDRWLELTPGLNVETEAGECFTESEIAIFESHDEISISSEELSRLADEFSISPEMAEGGLGANTGRMTFGVCGGPNPRLPGLVLLADQGPGVILGQDLKRASPLRQSNLAVWIDSVAYELKDSHGRTRIVTHMNVDGGLFVPITLYDDFVSCPASPDPCSGSETKVVPDASDSLVTLRAFVVQGRAPAALADENGDGQVDISDAHAKGLQLLSGEAVFRFTQLVEDPRRLRYPVDFDGNGLAAVLTWVEPPSPGRLTPPPE